MTARTSTSFWNAGFRPGIFRHALAFILLFPALAPTPLMACAACFGQSDSPMAKGMNAGIFTLLFCIMSVLAAIAFFFFYILRRAARLAAQAPPAAPASISQPTHR